MNPSKQSNFLHVSLLWLQSVLYANFSALLKAFTWCTDVMQKSGKRYSGYLAISQADMKKKIPKFQTGSCDLIRFSLVLFLTHFHVCVRMT